MLLLATTSHGVTSAATAHAAAGANNAPFWTGNPDAATFTKVNEARIEKAKQAIGRMLAVKEKRTIDNTLKPYDEASNYLDMAGTQASLIENVHPDSAMRTTAEELSQKVSAYGTELSLDRRVYDALAA